MSPAPNPRLVFSDYLRTKRFAERFRPDPTVRERMIGADVRSLNGLLRWYRERYPDNYRRYCFFSDCTVRDVLKRVWADFLSWQDAARRAR